MNIQEYIKKNESRFLEELFGLIRIPSISSASENKPEMYKAAEYWKKILLEAGADKAEIFETGGNPVTYAEKFIHPDYPTVLVYGHMDVMPVDPIELWHSAPFEPEIRDGKIFARGADDDKGQSFMHAKAFEYLVKTNQLHCNVKFMIEGEEEIGSPNLGHFCAQNKQMLQSDIILVSDTGMIAENIPSITTGLRGLSYMQIEVTGPNRDLHSGLYGNAVANPANELAKMLAKLTNDDNQVQIPGFYDEVIQVSDAERASMNKAPYNEEEYKKAIGVKQLQGEKNYSTIERTGIRPSLDINGMWSGYTGEGAKTIIPSKAFAKVSMRLVPNQDHIKISELFEKYIYSIAPKSVDVKVTALHGGYGYVSPIDIPAYKAAEAAMKDVFGLDPIPVRSGGSIPIISTFEQILGTKSILMGFGLESDAIHSPNENYPLNNFFNGIIAISKFYGYFAEMKK
jgi:acetylornithine deacetylase/succinyl-diaminopimelate desuccinylase-like protein